MTLAVVVSLCAAVCFGAASVLQHDGALRVRRRGAMHPGLLADLARRPGWLLGLGVQFTGVALHLYAVNLGPLSLVQPLLTTGLVIALVAQRLSGRRVLRRELLAAGLVVVGLVVFLTVMPQRDPALPTDPEQWLPGLALAAAVLAVTLGVGLTARGSLRCACLGAAAGTLLATSAALGKAWGGLLVAHGLPSLLTSWQLWSALGCGLAGALLCQTAFQSGPLGASLAAMMAIDPAIGVGLGVVVFGEPFATAETALPRCVGFVLTLVGVVLLAWSQRRDTTAAPEPRGPALLGGGARR